MRRDIYLLMKTVCNISYQLVVHASELLGVITGHTPKPGHHLQYMTRDDLQATMIKITTLKYSGRRWSLGHQGSARQAIRHNLITVGQFISTPGSLCSQWSRVYAVQIHLSSTHFFQTSAFYCHLTEFMPGQSPVRASSFSHWWIKVMAWAMKIQAGLYLRGLSENLCEVRFCIVNDGSLSGLLPVRRSTRSIVPKLLWDFLNIFMHLKIKRWSTHVTPAKSKWTAGISLWCVALWQRIKPCSPTLLAPQLPLRKGEGVFCWLPLFLEIF